MERIPEIIHQTWKDSELPPHLIAFVQSWKDYHPDWEHRLWTDDLNREFIIKYAPNFLPVYDHYPKAIQRVDAVRYFILYELGGIFIDLDFLCLQNIEALLKGHSCVFGIEPKEHAQRFKKEMIVCNAFMACEPKNDFFRKICKTLQEDSNGDTHATTPISWMDVLNTTGPFKLTEVYQGYEDKHKIELLSDTIYPLTIAESRELIKK